jgi:hypothetical protein
MRVVKWEIPALESIWLEDDKRRDQLGDQDEDGKYH